MRRNLVLAAALLLSISPALAQTPTQQPPAPQAPAAHAKATPEVKDARKALRQACMEDVRTLCSDAQPGGGKLMQCLKTHKDQVSAGCKSAFQHLREVRRGA